jgi:UDPglucose 6-dehydrogenase
VRVNARQRRVLAEKVLQHFNGDLKGRTIALWGLAFKANTDDMREASSLAVIEELTAAGARVVAYDPVAMPNAREFIDGNSLVSLVGSAREAVEGADALAVITEWLEFRSPDFNWLASALKAKSLFDGRNLYDPCDSPRRRTQLLRHRTGLTRELTR